MKTIKHNDLIRLAAWQIETVKVCTLIGFYDGIEADAEASRQRHGINTKEVFGSFAGYAICANPEFYRRDKADRDAATVVENGEIVEVDGKRYTISVMLGNEQHPRNSDPIHFIPAGE